MKAQLILENGKRFTGTMFGACKDIAGEVVFSTGMGGYQEALTDPSAAGQIVTMTFPLIGNYGINFEDMEADKVHLSAVVVREKCDHPSNFRNEMTLDDFLKQQGVTGIEGIDTRALTRLLRNNGSMKGVIAAGEISDEAARAMIEKLDNSDAVMRTTTPEPYVLNRKGSKNIAYIDLGTKDGILRQLEKRDCRLSVFPANTPAEDILSVNPDMVFVSNGPGAPENIPETIENIKKIIGKAPLCGICLGHLAIGLALGAGAEKMKFGHHGESQPVKDTKDGKVYVTAQSHDYILTGLPEGVSESFRNVNDGSCEGIESEKYSVMSVQFRPEAAPGPLETEFMFDRFMSMLDK